MFGEWGTEGKGWGSRFFRKLYDARSRYLVLSPYRRELTTNFLQKNSLNFSFEGLKIEVTFEKISQTCGDTSSGYCSGCFYAILLPPGKITVL